MGDFRAEVLGDGLCRGRRVGDYTQQFRDIYGEYGLEFIWHLYHHSRISDAGQPLSYGHACAPSAWVRYGTVFEHDPDNLSNL